jgi:hypothetical protein
LSKFYTELIPKLKEFIADQKIFFVGTADTNSRVNLSPKVMDSLKNINVNQLIWINLTGNGNETTAQVLEHPRTTLMF